MPQMLAPLIMNFVKMKRSFLLLILIMVVSVLYSCMNCNTDGVTFDEANDIASSVVKEMSERRRNPIDKNIVLDFAEFDSYSNMWVFNYTGDGCVVSVIVDKCGSADIGGLSKECLTERELELLRKKLERDGADTGPLISD